MSCGQPSQDDEQSENIPILPPPSATCVRCGQPPKIVVRATAWCHDCFLASFQGRFRKSLEGAKVVSKNGFETYQGVESHGKKIQKKEELSKVVLAFSGGSSSRAMLELFKTSYYKQPEPEPEPEVEPVEAVEATEEDGSVEVKKPKKKGPKKQFFPPAFSECQVVFVDESELPGFGPNKTEEIRQIVEQTTPFRFVPLKLSSIFDSSSDHDVLSVSTSSSVLPSHPSTSSAPSSSPVEKLLALLHPTPPLPPTTYATLHQSLVQSLLLSTARATPGCDVLLLGDNSTRLGIKTISAMSQGRGWSLGEEVSIEFVHRQSPDGAGEKVLVCRPMGASLAKEVGYYVTSEGLETVLVTNEDTSVNAIDGEGGTVKIEKDIKKVGIGKLVEDFVLNLEAQFPSTVSIITKTAHKLGMRSADAAVAEGEHSTHNCALCEMPAQVNAEGWNRAITISDLISAREALAQPALPTSLEASTPSSSSSTGVKRREPYQPSKNHLLPESTLADSAADSHPSLASSAPSPSDTSATETGSSFPLAGHLCYACLLLLQTSKPANSKKAPAIGGDTLNLPPYVLENVERRRIETRREVKGAEGLRKEIEEYLLE
ncbi:hypothetical protein JCM11491_006378 [Sporobolomyces phaffii]